MPKVGIEDNIGVVWLIDCAIFVSYDCVWNSDKLMGKFSSAPALPMSNTPFITSARLELN